MRRFRAGPAALAAFLFAAAPSSARAQNQTGLQTPSHNIFCLLEGPFAADAAPDLRCELADITSRPPPRPRRCEGDWGHGFDVAQNGAAGERICISDTIKDLSYPVLPYGRRWSAEGFTCLSETIGLTCSNAAGHGFMLSRAVQRLF